MSTENMAPSTPEKASAESSTRPGGETRPSISPAQRWLLVTENVYARAQKRGFVGGDLLQDLLEAEQEIDAAYHTDFEVVFSMTDVAEITEQLKGVFAGYGFDHRNLNNLMENNREAVERIAAFNQQVVESTSTLAVKQTDVLEKVANEAMKTLQSFAMGWVPAERVMKQAELSMQVIDNTLTHFRALSNSVAEITEPTTPVTANQSGIRDLLIPDYRDKPLRELAEASVTGIKGISETVAKRLSEQFAITSIRDLATNRFVEWANGVVLLADTADGEVTRPTPAGAGESEATGMPQQSLSAVADAPVAELHGLSESQSRLLHEAFGVNRVRDLAENPLVRLARGIVALAEAER